MVASTYNNAKEALEAVQRLPLEAQRAIMKMLYGAIVISDMYSEVAINPSEPNPPDR